MFAIADNLGQYIERAPLFAFIAAFISGVITSFTPCVYPVIPVTVGVIGGMAKGKKLQGFIYSLLYVFGIATMYAVLGIAAALSGKAFGRMAGTPWPYLIVGNICILFSLVTFEAIPFRLPSFIMNMGTKTPKGGNGIVVYLLGIGSGLIIGPCTAAPLGVILSFVATKQNTIYGASLLFTFACGMGLLLIIIGTFAGLVTSIPKAGKWMTIIQKCIAWLLLLVGEYLLIKAGMMWY